MQPQKTVAVFLYKNLTLDYYYCYYYNLISATFVKLFIVERRKMAEDLNKYGEMSAKDEQMMGAGDGSVERNKPKPELTRTEFAQILEDEGVKGLLEKIKEVHSDKFENSDPEDKLEEGILFGYLATFGLWSHRNLVESGFSDKVVDDIESFLANVRNKNQ